MHPTLLGGLAEGNVGRAEEREKEEINGKRRAYQIRYNNNSDEVSWHEHLTNGLRIY